MKRLSWSLFLMLTVGDCFGGSVEGTIMFLEPKTTILEVVRQAKAEGYRTVVLATTPSTVTDAPEPYRSANSCIDQLVTIASWRDESAVTELVHTIHSENPVAGIYFGSEPQALVGAKLRKVYGLASTSAESMDLILDKYRMRETLRASGLSDLKAALPHEISEDRWPFPKGAFFKPRHGLASLHVKHVSNMSDVRRAKLEMTETLENDPLALKEYMGSSEDFYLEQAAEGELMSVESIVNNGEVHVLGLLSRIMNSTNSVVEMGSIFPYPHPMAEKIIQKVRLAHAALNFTDGPTHVEVIVSPGGEVEIIDFNPRFVGADVLQSVNHAYGIKVESALLGYATGQFRLPRMEQSAFCCLQYGLAPKGVTKIVSICLPFGEDVVFSASFVRPPVLLQNRDRQIDYIGCYLVKGSSFEGAAKRSRLLRDEFKVNGTNHADY